MFWRLPAQRRLVIALGLSLIVHGWLVQGYGTAPRVGQVAEAPLSVRLTSAAVAAVPVLQPLISESSKTTDAAEPTQIAAARVSDQTLEKFIPPPRSVIAERIQPAAETSAALPQPQDPTYYTARSLDVFPRTLAAAWDLAPYLSGPPPAGARIRATLLIDEAGVVNEVSGIDADPANVIDAAREMFLRARFTPARKDGRIVKAQVRVSVAY